MTTPSTHQLTFAENGHEPSLLVAWKPRRTKVTLHLEKPCSGDITTPSVKIEEAAIAITA